MTEIAQQQQNFVEKIFSGSTFLPGEKKTFFADFQKRTQIVHQKKKKDF